MLKWLVTKGPSSSLYYEKSITDDPLATISRRRDKNSPVYAVSRVNPIFEEVDDKEINVKQLLKVEKEEIIESLTKDHHPESPPTDRESVRSSGYGSKEADSVSYKSDEEDDEDPFYKSKQRKENHTIYDKSNKTINDWRPKSNSVEINSYSLEFSKGKKVAELRKSFEVDEKKKLRRIELVERNKTFIGCISIGNQRPPHSSLEVIPEASESAENSPSKSSWPRVSHLAATLQRQADKIHWRREQERLKNSNCDYRDFTANRVPKFNPPLVNIVTQNRDYISAISLSPEKSKTSPSSEFLNFEPNFGLTVNNEKRFPSYFHQQNVANLQSQFTLLSLQPDSLINEDTLRLMNYPDKETRTVDRKSIHSNFHHASYQNISPPNGQRSNIAIKKKGLNVVKDLWEKTGLRTNGRKLLVDVNHLISENNSSQISSSYGSTERRSLPSTINNRRRRESSRQTSSVSSKSSHSYENILNFPPVQTFSYGLDNPAFVDDDNIYNNIKDPTQSGHSRSSFQFQHNLTDFQRRVSDKLQSDSSHRKSWLDVEKGLYVSNESTLRRSVELSKTNSNEKKKVGSKSKNKGNIPAKAVNKFGLEDDEYKLHDWNSHKKNLPSKQQMPQSHYISPERNQKWEFLKNNYSDKNLSGIFSLHPNSEAPLCKDGGTCQDFTIDARRIHRNLMKSSRSERRKKCCIAMLIFFALAFFVGAIVGVSWYYTGGERIFGPM